MIILRRKIFSNILEKLFTNNAEENFLGQCKLFNADLLKIFVLRDKTPYDEVKHWTEEFIGAFDKIKEVYDKTDIMQGFTENRRGKLRNYFKKYPKPKDYFLFIWKDVYNQKENGKYKYRHIMKERPTEEDIQTNLHLFKYVLLCMCGQMDPRYETPWGNYKEVITTIPNYMLSPKFSQIIGNSNELKSAFGEILSKIDY